MPYDIDFEDSDILIEIDPFDLHDPKNDFGAYMPEATEEDMTDMEDFFSLLDQDHEEALNDDGEFLD
jgi:hypothetical protein